VKLAVSVTWWLAVLRGGAAVRRWTCDWQVADSSSSLSAFTQHTSTQPNCIPPGSLNWVPASAGGTIPHLPPANSHLCRVADNTVWSHMVCAFPAAVRLVTAIHCLLYFTYFWMPVSDSASVWFSLTKTKTKTKKSKTKTIITLTKVFWRRHCADWLTARLKHACRCLDSIILAVWW